MLFCNVLVHLPCSFFAPLYLHDKNIGIISSFFRASCSSLTRRSLACSSLFTMRSRALVDIPVVVSSISSTVAFEELAIIDDFMVLEGIILVFWCVTLQLGVIAN